MDGLAVPGLATVKFFLLVVPPFTIEKKEVTTPVGTPYSLADVVTPNGDGAFVAAFGTTLLGDIDGSWEVDSVDASFILQQEAGLIGAVPRQISDVSGDRRTDVTDAALILQFAAHLISHF